MCIKQVISGQGVLGEEKKVREKNDWCAHRAEGRISREVNEQLPENYRELVTPERHTSLPVTLLPVFTFSLFHV